jgi:hypothetical protein
LKFIGVYYLIMPKKLFLERAREIHDARRTPRDLTARSFTNSFPQWTHEIRPGLPQPAGPARTIPGMLNLLSGLIILVGHPPMPSDGNRTEGRPGRNDVERPNISGSTTERSTLPAPPSCPCALLPEPSSSCSARPALVNKHTARGRTGAAPRSSDYRRSPAILISKGEESCFAF